MARRANPVMAGFFFWLFGMPGCVEVGLGERPMAVSYQPGTVDILFVIDNSGSMVAEQLNIGSAFATLVESLDRLTGWDSFHVGVITTGLESVGCPPCTAEVTNSCVNETGEGGRLQNRVGQYADLTGSLEYSCRTAFECKVIDSSSDACFFNSAESSGVALVGTSGCGYERGLAAMRAALQPEMLAGPNAGFLRDEAVLVVVVVSDEEDCGMAGEVTENLAGVGGNICYFASKGEDADGNRVDSAGNPLVLTPVEEYRDFLMQLKGNRDGMVRFAAIVGVADSSDPGATVIEFTREFGDRVRVVPACQTPGCTEEGDYCKAYPGTRYVRLAQLFGLGMHGFVDSICQPSFTNALASVGEQAVCPRRYHLSAQVQAPETAVVSVNGKDVPRSAWEYIPPTVDSPGGSIAFVQGYWPCDPDQGGELRIEVWEESSRPQ